MKKSLQVQLFANATLSDYRFREFVNAGVDYSGNRIPGTPGSMVNLGMDVASRTGFYGNVNYQYVGEMALRDDNSLYRITSYNVCYTKLLRPKLIST